MDTVIEITRIVSHAPEAIFSCLRHALVILECIGIFKYAALELIQFSKSFAEGMLKIPRHMCSITSFLLNFAYEFMQSRLL